MLVDDVHLFPRVPFQIVELGTRRADVFPAARAQGAQLGPSHVEFRVERLCVGVRRFNGLSFKSRHEADALTSKRNLASQEGDQSGKKIDSPYLGFDVLSSGNAWACHDPGDMQRGIVEEHAVVILPMLRKAFAMVSQHGCQSPFRRRLFIEGVEQSAEFPICVSDFAVIRALLVLPLERLRRIMRSVRIVDVNPQKEGFLS